jgi:hypothetical protein
MSLVVIKSFDSYFTANILLTRLQSDGFECYLKDENTVTIDPLLSNAIGGIKLVAREENVAAIRAIIAQYEAGIIQSAICPKCNTTGFALAPKKSPSNAVAAVLSTLGLSNPFKTDKEYLCNNCGFTCDSLDDFNQQ